MSTIVDSKNHLKLNAPPFISKQKMSNNSNPQLPDKAAPTQEVVLNKKIIKKNNFISKEQFSRKY